ncbi:MAG: TonB-dependent receptor [Bacteroidales bacterium]|nr:TonB-dependent receptor [Bacteroidales bacterium]
MRKHFQYIATAALFAVSAINASAGTPTSPQDTVYTLESISVTGSRVPLTLNQSARMVTVLDSVALSTMPANSINDLLKFAVGVDVRQRGVMGMQTDISIRGGTFDQIAILLNGVSISDPQTGHNAGDFPVDISEIDRIEILEGPAARAYGTSSLLGAVNIVTKTHEKSGVSARVEGGSHKYLSASVGGNINSGKFSNQLSFNYTRTDGYTLSREGTNNTDFAAAKAFYQGNYDGSKIGVKWHTGLSVKDFGSNTFYSPRFDDQFEHVLKTYTAIQAETYGRLHFKPSIFWNHTEDRFELFRGRIDKYPFNFHRTNVVGANIGGWVESNAGRTAFGAEVRNEGIISTNLGEPLQNPIAVKGYDAAYKVGLNRTDINIYLEHNVILNRFTFSAGVTAAKNTGNDEGLRLYPGADASFRISDHWKAYASYNSSLRMPTFTELYYSVGGHLADKNLKAEKMKATEVGLKYLNTGIRAIATVYYHHGTDLIDWIKDTSVPDAPWTSVNHSVINSIGEEFTLRLEPQLLLGRPEFPVRSFNISYAHIDQDKKADKGFESYYSLEYLRNKFVVQLDLQLFGKLNLDLSGRWHDRSGSYRLYQDGVDTGRIVEYEPYTVIDAKLSWDEPSWSIFLTAENLLDRTYYDHANIPQPGLWLKAGIKLRVE